MRSAEWKGGTFRISEERDRDRSRPRGGSGTGAARPATNLSSRHAFAKLPGHKPSSLARTGSDRAGRKGQSSPGKAPSDKASRRRSEFVEAHSPSQACLDNPAFRSIVKKSFSTSAKPLPRIELRATNTKSTAFLRSCWCKRKASLKRRLARLRTTALPIRLEVITPNRDAIPSLESRQFAIRQPLVILCPSCRMRLKSRPSLMRADRPRRNLPGELAPMQESNRRQAFAPNAAPIPEDGAAALA